MLGAGKAGLFAPLLDIVTAADLGVERELTKRLPAMVPGSRVVYGDTDSVMVILDMGAEHRHDIAAHFAGELTPAFMKPQFITWKVRSPGFSPPRTLSTFARVSGTPWPRLFMRHLLPNVMNSVIVLITLDVGKVIIFESGLSFLGLGVPPPTPTWGGMLSGQGRLYMTTAMWLALAPGLCITVLILAFNILSTIVLQRILQRSQI